MQIRLMNVFVTDHPLVKEPSAPDARRRRKLVSLVKKLILVGAGASFLIGLWIFLYDFRFIQRYGIDANDVMSEIEAGRGVVDWETGMRPAYAYYPAWIYGVFCWLLTFAVVIAERMMGRKPINPS